LTATQRGGKNASVTVSGKPLRLTLKSCTTPFECQAFGGQGGDLCSLDIRADDELQAFASALDRKVLAEGLKLVLKESGYKTLLKESKSDHLRGGPLAMQVLRRKQEKTVGQRGGLTRLAGPRVLMHEPHI